MDARNFFQCMMIELLSIWITNAWVDDKNSFFRGDTLNIKNVIHSIRRKF